MPSLHRIGKDKVINHHHEVPYRVLQKQYDFGESEGGNMIIHGDNLEGLKSLLPQYEGKIKCIYIDPPYNTGKEGRVYNDNMNNPKIKKWLGDIVGKEGEDFNRHDKWLCMMYPRLKLLHKLLSDDGVIMVSMDDNEITSLRYILDEIFGAKSFVSNLIRSTEGHTDNQFEIKVNHEYILTYVKNPDYKKIAIGSVIDPNTKEDSNLWKGFAENSITKNGPKNPVSKIKLLPGFPSKLKEGIIKKTVLGDNFYLDLQEIGFLSKDLRNKYNLNNSLPIKHVDMTIKDFKLQNECIVETGWANANKLKSFIENQYQPIYEDGGVITFYLSENGVIYYHKERESAQNIVSVLNNMGTTEIMKTELSKMGIKFDYPKPNGLIEYLLKIGNVKENDIVLDSFAGSGSTAHAVLNHNKQDGGNRKFILLELMDYAETITAERVKRVINGYGEGSKAVEGTGGGFSFYEVGERLFDDEDNLNENVDLETIKQYIRYTETKTDYRPQSVKYLLGSYKTSDYYFYYEHDRATVLDLEFLATLSRQSEYMLIYADICNLSKEFLDKHKIIFKKIPRDITRF